MRCSPRMLGLIVVVLLGGAGFLLYGAIDDLAWPWDGSMDSESESLLWVVAPVISLVLALFLACLEFRLFQFRNRR